MDTNNKKQHTKIYKRILYLYKININAFIIINYNNNKGKTMMVWKIWKTKKYIQQFLIYNKRNVTIKFYKLNKINKIK